MEENFKPEKFGSRRINDLPGRSPEIEGSASKKVVAI